VTIALSAVEIAQMSGSVQALSLDSRTCSCLLERLAPEHREAWSRALASEALSAPCDGPHRLVRLDTLPKMSAGRNEPSLAATRS